MKKPRNRRRSESGQSLVEYAFILVFVALVAILILRGIGGSTNNMLQPANNAFESQP